MPRSKKQKIRQDPDKEVVEKAVKEIIANKNTVRGAAKKIWNIEIDALPPRQKI